MNARRTTLISIIVIVGVLLVFVLYRQPGTVPARESAPAPAAHETPSHAPESPAPLIQQEPDRPDTTEPVDSGTLVVRVLDEATGQPVTLYEVTLLDHAPGDAEAWAIAQTGPARLWVEVSDEDGRSSWSPDMLETARALGVRAERYAPEWKPLAPGASTLEFLLSSEAVVRGRIVSEHGAPLAGAGVTVANRTLAANGEGRFVASGLSPGSVAIRASHDEYQPEQVSIELAAGREHDIQLVLKRGGALVGIVRNETEPLAGAKVAAMFGGDLRNHRTVTTDAEGMFRIAGLSPGEWRVMAQTASDGTPAELHQLAIVESGRETHLEFAFGEPARIEGLVIQGNRPVRNALVRARAVSGSDEQYADAYTNDGGWYRLEIVPGSVQVTAEVPETDPPRRKSTTLNVPPGTFELDFIFESAVPFSGRISGVSTDESVNVYVLPAGYEVDFSVPTWGIDIERDALAHTIADASGLFAIESLEPGTYALAILAFMPEPREGVDPLETARMIEREIDIQAGGGHIELGF